MSRYVVFARKSRDIMILGHDNDQSAMKELAESAVKEGRAAETFVVLASDYFSESDIAWGNVDTHIVSGVRGEDKPQSIPPLNPKLKGQGASAQESLATSDRPVESIQGNIEKAAQEQLASGEMVHTGEADFQHEQAKGNLEASREAPKPAATPALDTSSKLQAKVDDNKDTPKKS